MGRVNGSVAGDGGPDLRWFTAGAMTEAEFRAACVLHASAFPRPGRTVDDVVASRGPVWMRHAENGAEIPGGPLRSTTPARRAAIVDAAGVWRANAATITRRLATPAGPMTVLGLLDVATRPDDRGRGLGARVVRAAFGPVDRGEWPACLFQTGDARRFYEKLGARVVDNRFVDSTGDTPAGGAVFEDTHTMIYPADADWPTGEIDTLGPGY
ncbi:MAG: GNAT family N-acetyltransferase [Planctomycetota bacterium]